MLRCSSSRVFGAAFRQGVLQRQPSHHVPRTLFGRSANTSGAPSDAAAETEQHRSAEAGDGAASIDATRVRAIEEKHAAELEKAENAFKDLQVNFQFDPLSWPRLVVDRTLYLSLLYHHCTIVNC